MYRTAKSQNDYWTQVIQSWQHCENLGIVIEGRHRLVETQKQQQYCLICFMHSLKINRGKHQRIFDKRAASFVKSAKIKNLPRKTEFTIYTTKTMI